MLHGLEQSKQNSDPFSLFSPTSGGGRNKSNTLIVRGGLLHRDFFPHKENHPIMAFEDFIVTEHASESFMTKNSRELTQPRNNTIYTQHSSMSVELGIY